MVITTNAESGDNRQPSTNVSTATSSLTCIYSRFTCRMVLHCAATCEVAFSHRLSTSPPQAPTASITTSFTYQIPNSGKNTPQANHTTNNAHNQEGTWAECAAVIKGL